MGYSISWVAVRGISPEAVLERFNLRATGEKGDYTEHHLSTATLPDKWTLVVANRCDHRIVRPETLNAVSMGCEAVACTIEEHVMICSSELWKDGTRIWRIEHDAQESIDHISADGVLPSSYVATRDDFAAQQQAEGGANAGVDLYFEIPLVVAKSLVGFKHDESDELVEHSSRALEDLLRTAHRKRWWQLWK